MTTTTTTTTGDAMRSNFPNGTPRFMAGVPVVMTLTLGRAPEAPGEAAAGSPVTLSFADLFTVGAATLELSPVARHLNGRQVRLVGFVAKIASRPRGGFYLCPQPVAAGPEAHGGAGLPPDAVRVTVPSAASRLLAAAAGRVEVIGRLEVGYRREADGEVSWIRLISFRRVGP